MARPKGSKNKTKEKVENKIEKKSRPKKIKPTKEKDKKEEFEEIQKEDNKSGKTEKTFKPKRKSLSTCAKCGGKFATETMTIHGGKKYCEFCYSDVKKDSEYYKKLCDYIYKDIYHEDCNMPFITSQIKKLKQEIEGLTNRRILITLQYAINYDNFDTTDLDPQWGINNLVTKYYYETKKFYNLKERINKDKDEIDKMLNMETKVVYIKRSDIIERQEKYEEEKRKRYAKQLLGEEDMNEIIDYLNEFGTKENLGFKNN